MTRRGLLRRVLAASADAGTSRAWPAFGLQAGRDATVATPANSTLALAQFLNSRRFLDLPRQAIEHAKMILASTLASAAFGGRARQRRVE